MMEAAITFEHAGLRVSIFPDEEAWATNPQDNDNAGTIYSWVYRRDFEGDEYISEPDCTIYDDDADELRDVSLDEYMRHEYDAVLTIPLYFADYGSGGARIYESDDPNCAICFTQEELDREWSGDVEAARRYASARINELDEWMRGEVYGYVVEDEDGETLDSVWGFIGDAFSRDAYIIEEAKASAEACARTVAEEHAKAFDAACRDIETV